MKTFLQYVAEDLYDKLNGDFESTTIVFPNKRATLFFNSFLWEKSGGKTMWTPEYTTISELFQQLSHYSIAEPVQLICKLYEVYTKHFEQSPTSFDELYSFLEMMLSDFEDVDSNLVPADKLFHNISDLNNLTDFTFLEHEQVEVIRKFFTNLNWDDSTPTKKRFSTLWNKMYDIYVYFQQLLLSDESPSLYEGMLKRLVISEACGDCNGAMSDIASKLTSTHYVFVGFNVLNKVEQELFHYIKKKKTALFYWDYDISYCSGNPFSQKKNTHGFEAGTFILENIRNFGSVFPPEHEAYNNMHNLKSINFIESPTENAQSRYVGTWIKEQIPADDKPTDTAIVLCNEDILQPVLHSIPSTIGEGKKTVLNVTMGYPLTETPVYSLVQSLLELQIRGCANNGSWRFRQVSAVLKHPYIKLMTDGNSNAALIKLVEKNIVFPTSEMFADDPLLSIIFQKRKGRELTSYLTEILTYAAKGFSLVGDYKDFNAQLYKESTFAAYTAVNRLHIEQERIPALASLSDSTISRLITQVLQRSTIPFHGEPADGLQVMGFLETRNLDFRNIILLSAGEGQMPRASKRSSLIPYSLQAAFGMTTIDKEVSIYAYYYYRLMQRAENITVLWNSSTEGGHKGEMSRFLLQMLIESNDIFAENQQIALLSFSSPSESMTTPSITIPKTDEIMRRLHERFDIATEESPEWKEKNGNRKLVLSPSAIHTYMNCPLQFFFRYVAALRPDDEVSDEIDDALFGDIFHYSMEQIYRPYIGKSISSAAISQIANNNTLIDGIIDRGFLVKLYKIKEKELNGKLNTSKLKYSGAQLVKRHVLGKFIKFQLTLDAKKAAELEEKGGSFGIIDLEKTHYSIKSIQPAEDQPSFNIRIGGIIDRLDYVDDGTSRTVRVVDYKTSSSPHTASQIKDLFDPEKSHSNYHITQTMYYCEVLTREKIYGVDRDYCLVPAVMYYKKNKNGQSPVVSFAKEPGKRTKKEVTDYSDVRQEYTTHMDRVINGIFSPGSFTQSTTPDASCLYCDFKLLCGRNPQKKY